MNDQRSNILEEIEALLKSADKSFNDSKDWNESSTVGQVAWLIGMLEGKQQEIDVVWEMLERANARLEKFTSTENSSSSPQFS